MLKRLLKPSFPDFIFAAILCWMYVFGTPGFNALLIDGDTGWHIQTGQYILDHGSVPAHDIFSFSKPGEPWFAWEWGSDVIYALLFRAAGLKGVTLFAAALISLFAAMLLRLTIARGASPLFAIATTFVGVSAASLHFLARPHLFTLLLVPVFAFILDRDTAPSEAGKSSWHLWLLAPLTALWTNLHGGFLVGITLIGLYFAGAVVEIFWNGKSKDVAAWATAKRLALVGACCSAATLINPYGYQLHVHLVEFFRMDWLLSVVEEFQSPSFRTENMGVYELLLFAGVLAALCSISRRHVGPALAILFWAHQSLSAVRHVTIYVSLAAPIVACELTFLWRRFAEGAPRKSIRAVFEQLATESLPNFGHTSLWPATLVAVLAFVPFAGIHWPTDFPDFRFPTKMIARHKAEFQASSRPLTSDAWGSYLIFRDPQKRVYLDGRGDFYGEKLSKEFADMVEARKDWRSLLERNDFDLVLMPPTWPLASLLREDAGWRLVDEDKTALLFERVDRTKVAQR